jgi:hypothetical protein
MENLKLSRYSFNPSLLEINGRIWIKRFEDKSKHTTLKDVDKFFFDNLQQHKLDYLWLMGAWQNNEECADKYCFVEGLQKEYSNALPDWNKSDVIGSPYAIDEYSLNKRFGTKSDLLEFKDKLNRAGIKLILDFIPNHFNAESKLISSNPDLFLQADEELLNSGDATFFTTDDKIFAHGKDPYFDAWQDTVQVNYFNTAAYDYLTDILLNLTELCDGIRCDMAMLPLLQVFESTWDNVIRKMNYTRPAHEFWESAIKSVKDKRKDFIFIAEAYWGIEHEIQNLGFDYTYDKRLTDRLRSDTPANIIEHLRADYTYQSKSVRFLENHDEDRAVDVFGIDKSKAAAVVCSTLPGMRFYHDGQFEGKTIKLPVQLGREPVEEVNTSMQKFYKLLLSITGKDVCKYGIWKLLDALPAGSDDMTYQNIFSWVWNNDDEYMIVVINYSTDNAYCRLRIDLETNEEEVELIDLMDDKSYKRNWNEIVSDGLFIQLKGYQSQIFQIIK